MKTYGIDRAAFNQGKNAQFKPQIIEELSATLTAKGASAVGVIDNAENSGRTMCLRCQDGEQPNGFAGQADIQNRGGQNTMDIPSDYSIRRITPLEEERLQGFPDGWTDIGDWVDSKGKTHKGDADAPRYTALGNSIAIPFWKSLAKKISAQYDRDITMGSLFDGIGGFPYAFEFCNGKGSARWASEIEEFPIAVTKKRFGEE